MGVTLTFDLQTMSQLKEKLVRPTFIIINLDKAIWNYFSNCPFPQIKSA